MAASGAGNIYGVDVKLSPDGPVGIELNGVDFGTDFFKSPEGAGFYRMFARTLGAAAGGKPIFFEGFDYKNADPLTRLGRLAALRKDVQKRMLFAEEREKVFGRMFEGHYSWLEDVIRHETEDDHTPDNEHNFYALWAERENVPLFVYKDVKFSDRSAIFTLLNGRRMQLKARDIGMVKSSSGELERVPEPFRHLFLNSAFLEGILDAKPLMHYVAAFGSAGGYFPLTMPYGLGVAELSELIEFVESLDGQCIVRKRGDSAQGVGVEILDRSKLLAELKSRTEEKLTPGQMAALSGLFLTLNVESPERLQFVSVLQEFVPSVQILNPATNTYHDGCARVVVYSQPGRRPKTLGAQWRLAPEPLGNNSAPLEARFRANLSRGATAVPMSIGDEQLVSTYAENMISAFEASLMKTQHYIKEFKGEMLARFKREGRVHEYVKLTDIGALTLFLFSRNFVNRMTSAGGVVNHPDGKLDIVHVPGQIEAGISLAKSSRAARNRQEFVSVHSVSLYYPETG